MKKLTTLYFTFFFMLLAKAQKENYTWYFGKGVGINFNYTPPKPLTDGKLSSIEGCAVISDKSGQLLFYSNGMSVYNRKHELMMNGSGLMGNTSSTNNVAIVPLPGNKDLFYLFAIGSATFDIDEPKLTYNVINIKGDGGYGEVVQKNIDVESHTLEKLAVVTHCDNTKAWVIIRKWETDEYHAYLLNASGLSTTPVVSHTGLVIDGGPDNYIFNAIGTLKSSVDGTKLVAVHSMKTDMVELMDFNATTGAISNPITFKPNAVPYALSSYLGLYGAEFSPNNDLLYISANNSKTDPATVYQYDISSNNQAAIMASKKIIMQTGPLSAGALQLAPDKKIYMAMVDSNVLSIIEDPDVAGAGCNFKLNSFQVGASGTKFVQYGLPTFTQTSLDPSFAPFDFSRSGKCIDKNIQFNISRTTGMDSVRWFFGDTQESTTLSPLHHYAFPDYYDVKLVVYKKDCTGTPTEETIQQRIWIAKDEDLLETDKSICDFAPITLTANAMVQGADYLWNTGDEKLTTTASTPGKYWFQIKQNGCTASDTINVILKPRPSVNLGKDTSVCYGKPVTLTAVTTSSVISYKWNTGETTRAIKIERPGKYAVTVTAECEAKDSVNIATGDCDIFLPTAFTPNGDTRNDKFGVLNDFTASNFIMQVYDRWGIPVFVSNSITDQWDGNYKGKPMPNGSYTWIISYINGRGHTKRLKGTVMIIR